MKFETIKNNKKILLALVIVFVVILTLIITTSLAKYKVTESINIASGTINYSPSDLNLMGIYLESESGYTQSSTIPESGYVLNESESYCKIGDTETEATIKYDMTTRMLTISPMTTKGMKCYLYFDEKVLAADQIIALAGNGQVFNEGDAGYRYEGLNVDNYVEFNNETWRILAVEEGSKIGLTSGEYYIKLIREESIGDLAWDTNHSSVWSTSTLYNLLNNDYLNKTGDYASTGISSDAKGQIVLANWYTNGVDSLEYTTSQFYNYERADLTNYVNSYIGLMYPSDYGYASPTSVCGGSTLANYYDVGCYEDNWLYKWSYSYWTITPLADDYDDYIAFYVAGYGALYSDVVLTSWEVRPSVYLRSNIKFVKGTDGSSGNMFKIVN